MGRKKRPIYGVVAADTRSPRDGRFIEDLGRYEPLNEPERVTLNNERILYWLENGAQPTDTVRSILSKHGLMMALHMKRKGVGDDEIWAAVDSHRSRWAELEISKVKVTAKERRIAALAEEESGAKVKAVEIAKKSADVEAKAQAELEKAREKAVKDREQAAEEARIEQAEANVEQEKADVATDAVAETKKAAAEPEAAAEEEAAVVKPEAATEEAAVVEPEAATEEEAAAEPEADEQPETKVEANADAAKETEDDSKADEDDAKS